MLHLRDSSDPSSRDIYRDNKLIGYLQWHAERENRVVLIAPLEYLTIEEMRYLCAINLPK